MAIGTDAVYLNVSQYPFRIPTYFRWLQKRPDVKPVFMIHDLLPIEYPEFFHPDSVKRHARRLNVFAKIAAGAIVSTPTVADALLAHLKGLGRKTLPLLIQPLPVSPTFHGPREHDEGLAAQPYFIICGTIEPRKNHLLLLNLWRELARSFGPATPKLIVAGARGWENENIIDMLERCPAIRDHVIEALGAVDTIPEAPHRQCPRRSDAFLCGRLRLAGCRGARRRDPGTGLQPSVSSRDGRIGNYLARSGGRIGLACCDPPSFRSAGPLGSKGRRDRPLAGILETKPTSSRSRRSYRQFEWRSSLSQDWPIARFDR